MDVDRDVVTPTAPSVERPSGLRPWMPSRANEVFGDVERTGPPRRFLSEMRPPSWWQRLCIRIGFWFLARGGA